MQLDPQDRITRVDAGNPYRPASAATDLELPQPETVPAESSAARSLRYIAHGVYLQIFVGVGFLILAATGVDLTRLLAGPHI
ncbi:MAG: hypothetical protein WBD31_01120, partial [Rubripirellula sp.]